MEFQSPEDNAWYDVNLIWDAETITIEYVGFPENYNEIYNAEDFNAVEELEDFMGRFRQSSVQLQDHDCKNVFVGKTVCASYNFENGDVKFFDALVVEVLNEKHRFKQGGEEECLCTYVVKWQNGPLEGERTFARIGDFCLTPPKQLADPSLSSFVKLARGRIEKVSVNPSMNSEEFFRRLRRQRRNRYACRTMEGRLNGRCKRTSLDVDEDVSAAA
ncbi:uncharacterized protein LOC110628793 [Manihot esculenta]|uniref:SAWADEE domain-containing protein n=1 Tax=Manihot esculenta TaxID=3983 RepID=A0A2C9UV01_MANES|nr:uncharacterized protein LOC110628793 [Manihot esculenta]OAY35330.1 hypothetical protein MANES_12G092200v8 [Manihot esculenta]